MFPDYFKTAARNFKRNKSYSLINIFGLAVGIAASLLLFFVIQFETSFDNFHKKKDNIYRIASGFHNQDGMDYTAGVSFPVAAQLRLDFPQLKEVASIFNMGAGQINIQNDVNVQQKKLHESNIFYAEPEFFKMFDFEWLAGNANASLIEPNSVVLTQDIAEKYFGKWRYAIGKTIKHDNKYIYKVAGILKNVPANTDFPLGIVVSYATLKNTNFESSLQDWVGTFVQAYTFVELPPGFPVNNFNDNLRLFARKHKPAENANDIFIAQPLAELHYDDRFGNYRNHTFSHELVNALALIGIFLIVIACVNFINLATAQAVNRSKEVGVRKVLGSNRLQLILQFLGETAFITVAAIIIAVIIAITALPLLNNLLETKMTISFIVNPELILFIVIITVLITLLSGIYPAIILSGFNPVTALKTRITSTMVGGISLRRVLVVLQFAIAQILIIGMLIVVSQMDYFKNASLGFDKAFIINVPIPNDSISHTKIAYIRNSLLNNPDIKNVSFSYASPSANDNWTHDFEFDHSARRTDFSANLKWADADYFKTYNMHFVAGRPFSESDTIRELVVNVALLKKLGIQNPKKAIGKTINFGDEGKGTPVVGVVSDFNVHSLKEPMAPVVLGTWRDVYQVVGIKIQPGTEKKVLPYIETIWNKVYPEYVYEYKFLDETIAGFYKQENQLSVLYKIFGGIAILISCLGLYGLVSFMAVQRTKEIGIRKVLGASSGNILYLLSKEFTLLIIVAFTIAAPVGYYVMHQWLLNYTYRIQLGMPIFLMAIIGSVIIAWITVGYRAIKAAIANPVKSLRTE